ncbi:MAG: type II secretion system protein GspI [Gammaproteobacteria bacterium]|nr:type II secretion system protein GspI [Gammaproteobacteria bacterium]
MAQSIYTKGSGQSGFTLIEVLVAVMVLGIALVAITRSLSLGIRDAQRIQDKNIAHWVALNVLARAKLGVILTPESGGAMQTGQELMLNQTWTWKMQAQNVPDLPMRQISVQVFNSKQQSMETLQTYVYLPPASPYEMSIYAHQ